MTIYELRDNYYKNHPRGHFFDSATLRFFGERLSEMRVLKGIVKITDVCGQHHDCYMVSSFMHNAPVPHRTYHYFDTTTFDDVIRD